MLTQFEHQAIAINVRAALEEDLRSGDITASLISANAPAEAAVITREPAVLCGQPWVDYLLEEVDPGIKISWQVKEGDLLEKDQCFLKLSGSARHLLTAERTALNFLQTLMGTATECYRYAQKVSHTPVKLLDTRKTIPGLRIAQKYAVRVGGCFNHRIGLYDAFLIKENHIQSCGSITEAVRLAKDSHPGKPVEVEVETFSQLEEAIQSGAETIMLDNFSLKDIAQAVTMNHGNDQKLEASGNVDANTLIPIAEAGVDYISIGGLTKNLQAIDLSMRLS